MGNMDSTSHAPHTRRTVPFQLLYVWLPACPSLFLPANYCLPPPAHLVTYYHNFLLATYTYIYYFGCCCFYRYDELAGSNRFSIRGSGFSIVGA